MAVDAYTAGSKAYYRVVVLTYGPLMLSMNGPIFSDGLKFICDPSRTVRRRALPGTAETDSSWGHRGITDSLPAYARPNADPVSSVCRTSIFKIIMFWFSIVFLQPKAVFMLAHSSNP